MTQAPWIRPQLTVHGPNRALGGLYRSADVQHAGTTLAGIPMQTVSDAVVATVKLGYQVADRQIERGRRMGRQLSGAARRAGVDDANVVIDQTERLVLNALGLGLEWLEKAAAGDETPVKRLLQAEYRWLGQWLGLQSRSPGEAAPRGGHEETAQREPPPAARRGAPASTAPAGASGAEPAAPAQRVRPAVRVRHLAPAEQRRDVQVLRAELPPPGSAAYAVVFHHQARRIPSRLAGELRCEPARCVLSLETSAAMPSGVWRAAVCDDEGLQIGSLEIAL